MGSSNLAALTHAAALHEPANRPAERLLQSLLPDGTALFGVLDEIDYGLMLLAADGRVCYANHVALRECSAGFPMRLQDGKAQPRAERELEPYTRALAGARLGRRTMLTLSGAGAAVTLAVVPMQGLGDFAGGPTTLLVFGKRQVCEPLSVELYAQANHLTNAERAVLRGLCRGLRPGQIALENGVAVSTVRTQIRNIRVKTGTASIAELVRRITVLPPIVPALDKLNWASNERLAQAA